MAAELTLKDVLEQAIRKEIEARIFYTNLSREIDDKAAGEAFQELARQERGHQGLLEQYQRGELKEGSLSHGHVIDYQIIEHLEGMQISPEATLRDAFLLAASREKASHELYLGLAQIHPDGPVKGLLEELAAQELEHKQRVEFLYTEVAFPQTDGG